MLKKLALDKTKEYEKHIALEEISEMLVNFAKGLPHYLSIGAEQGDIDAWDDFVIITKDGSKIYIQVKRQSTDFSSDAIKRGAYEKDTAKHRKGELKELSAIDKAFKSLANRTLDDRHKSDQFWLVMPESELEIKKALEIRNLRNFKEDIKKDVTTSIGMKAHAKIDKNIDNVYLWLTTWCDFRDWEHIIRAFNKLELKVLGYETDIKARTLKNLNEIYSETENVYELILSYIDINSTYSGAIEPRHLLGKLQDYMRPGLERWSMFQTDGKSWIVSGTHDLEKNSEIEKPIAVVNKLWSNSCESVNSIKIYGDYRDDCCMANSLMRLSVHSLGTFNPFCSDKIKWENLLRCKTGNTLGISENDFDNLRVLNLSDDTYCMSESRNLNLIDEIEDYALQLNDAMYKILFNKIDQDIFDEIRYISKGDLRTGIESRWDEWKVELKDDAGKQRKLFLKILRPNAEGEAISAEIRSGLKTTKLLSKAVFMLLILSVCLDEGENKEFNAVADELRMKAIGLAYWSGPSDSLGKVVKIDHYRYINKLLENEQEEIIVLSNSNLPSSELLGDSLVGEAVQVGLLTEPKRPKLLITNDKCFERLVEKGDISCLSKYLKDKIHTYDKCIEDSIKNVAGGVL